MALADPIEWSQARWQLTAALLDKAERIDILGPTVRRLKDDMHVLTYLTARMS